MRLSFHFAAFLLCLVPLHGVSHSKTDVIVLANGNEIAGEIKGLLQGKLSYGTDSMGTVQVQWKDVTAVQSEFDYEVRLVSGDRYYGSLAADGETGMVKVLAEDREVSVPLLDVVELREIEPSVSDRFDIRLGIGYSYAKAGDVGTLSFTSELDYHDERGITGIDGRTSRTNQDGESFGSNRYSLSRQLWTRREQVIRWFDGSYEDNDELDLDYRFTAGGGLGKALFDTNHQSLIAFLGLQAAREKSSESDNFNSVEGVFGGTYALWRFDTPEVRVARTRTMGS